MGKANFGIALDGGNAAVEAGTHLKGTVFCDVNEAISGSQMTLTFQGTEATNVMYTRAESNDQGGTETERRFERGYRPLIKVNIPVNTAEFFQEGNRIPPGQYKLPFDFELPASLPATSSLTHDEGSFEIKYTMKAILKGSGMMWNYNCDREVQIMAKRLDSEPIPFHSQPVTEPVNLLCCINRGAMSFGVKVDDTRLDKAASTNICMSFRNRSSMSVQKVYAQLKQHAHWKGMQYHQDYTKILTTLEFPRFDGLDSRPVPGGAGSVQQQDWQDIFREVEEGTNKAEFAMPMDAMNTYHGKLITITHTLIIQADTPSCVTNPTIEIPFQVGEARGSGGAPSTSTAALAEDAVIPSSFGDNVHVASTAYVSSAAATVGGLASGGKQEEEGDVELSPLSSPSSGPASFASLLKEMEESISDLDLVQAKAADSAWKPIFEGLSPSDFEKLLKVVDSDFDEPRVAVAIATQVGSSKFACQHVVAALNAVSDWNRGTVVEKLLPLCSDLSANHEIIKAELTDWEKMVTERAFQNELNK